MKWEKKENATVHAPRLNQPFSRFFSDTQINFKIMNIEMKNRFIFSLPSQQRKKWVCFFIAIYEASVSNWLFLFF